MLWQRGGHILTNSSGTILDCDECPCGGECPGDCTDCFGTLLLGILGIGAGPDAKTNDACLASLMNGQQITITKTGGVPGVCEWTGSVVVSFADCGLTSPFTEGTLYGKLTCANGKWTAEMWGDAAWAYYGEHDACHFFAYRDAAACPPEGDYLDSEVGCDQQYYTPATLNIAVPT